MDEEQVAKLTAKTLQWASDRASAPAFIEFEAKGNEIEFTVVPGDRFRLTVEKVEAL